jgi:hypothetical protein
VARGRYVEEADIRFDEETEIVYEQGEGWFVSLWRILILVLLILGVGKLYNIDANVRRNAETPPPPAEVFISCDDAVCTISDELEGE